jgi:hypothetical protein
MVCRAGGSGGAGDMPCCGSKGMSARFAARRFLRIANVKEDRQSTWVQPVTVPLGLLTMSR